MECKSQRLSSPKYRILLQNKENQLTPDDEDYLVKLKQNKDM